MQMAMCRFRNVAVLDIYDAGFECQDNSSRNQHGKALYLRWEALDGPSSGVSTLTPLASCRRIRGLQPRVFRLENVRNCDMSRVLIFLKSQFPEYEIEVIEGDCADYNGKTERYRKWVVGVRRSCMRAPFPVWKELLLLLRLPRQDVDVRPCH